MKTLTQHLTRLIGFVLLAAVITITGILADAKHPGSVSPTTQTPEAGMSIVKKSPPLSLKQKAKKWMLARTDKKEWLCIKKIVHRESRWIPNLWNAQGSDAYGLGQVKGSYHYTKNKPFKQFVVAVRVAIHKHGTLCKALKHHDLHGWY